MTTDRTPEIRDRIASRIDAHDGRDHLEAPSTTAADTADEIIDRLSIEDLLLLAEKKLATVADMVGADRDLVSAWRYTSHALDHIGSYTGGVL